MSKTLAILFALPTLAFANHNDKVPEALRSDLVKSESTFPQVMEGNSQYLSIGEDEVTGQKYAIVLNQTGLVYYCSGDQKATKPSDFTCFYLPTYVPPEEK